ncbi:SMI1/KNR4 family protein [Parachryseolinea silvisoli]|uniref:SMI1/KNR4 family protein n=1 Tax=Parachryseolinea silvisoli TaxID=2873601 RepID=UPI002265B872|nr:SMI1/KNR4 family protein [Parachryseolinea silvisoli]MCD9014875.1 SMI1/KNR4 family protein [Parachryseolinea silvisoli]
MIDIQKIEKELGITLPPHYISFMQQFNGFASDQGDLVDLVYTDADRFIEMNQAILPQLPEGTAKEKVIIIGNSPWEVLHLINVQDATDERVYCFNDDDESLETSTLEFYDSLTDFKEAMDSLL